ncbi:MAG: hypothetical protein ACR2FZ_00865 [Thermoleophilaceae bacterium]
MANLTAKRTLVKSPPELWTELSELEALARHLGEFGEIRITRVEPERTVAWEGECVRGTVELEASGWGTKVTLTAAVTESEAPVEPAQSGLGADVSVPEPEAAALEPPAAVPRASVPRASVPEVETAASVPEPPPPRWEPPRTPRPAPPPRRGFLSRMFGRRPAVPEPNRPVTRRALEYPRRPAPEMGRRPEPQLSPRPGLVRQTPEPAPVPEFVAVRDQPEARPEPEPRPRAADTGAQRKPTALDAEGALAVLEGVLDTLGSAHHRPFSRG